MPHPLGSVTTHVQGRLLVFVNGHLLRCAVVKPIGIHGPEREPAAFAAIGVPAQFAEIIGGNPLPFGDAGAFFGAIPVRVQQQGRGAVFRHRTVGVRGLDFFDAHGGRFQAGVGAREQAGFQGRDGIVLHMNDRAGRVFGRSRRLVPADGHDVRRGMGNRLTLCVAGHELEFAPGVAIVGPVHAVEVGTGNHVAFLQQPGLRTIGAAQPQATLAGAVQALVGGHVLQHHVVGQAVRARTRAATTVAAAAAAVAVHRALPAGRPHRPVHHVRPLRAGVRLRVLSGRQSHRLRPAGCHR